MSTKKQHFNLDNFTKLDKIGKGGFSEVFRVQDKINAKIYAAKILIKKSAENSKELIPRLSCEVSIISKLNHPSILKFIGYNPIDFEKRSRPVIITEYASNTTLEYIIHLARHNKPLPFWNDTMRLISIYGIATGMQYLHSQNISHNDLKPGNILMDDYLFPKIADFGLAEAQKEEQGEKPSKMSTSMKGTPKYIAPEVWKKSQYTKACDVYAFAIIMYEIMTSLVPFKGFSNYDIFEKVVSNGYRPSFKEQMPKAYTDLIDICWSSDPEDRPTFDEIVEKLRNDRDFITRKVDSKYYFEFINYIDQFNEFSLDPSKLEELENSKQNRFKSISLKDQIEKIEKNKLKNSDSISASYSSSSTKSSLSTSSFFSYSAPEIELNDFQGFDELFEETQIFLKNSLEKSKRKFKKIEIDLYETVILFLNNSLTSSIFINILKYFENISFEVGYPSSFFNSIYSTILKLKNNEIPQIRIKVVMSLLFSIEDSAFNGFDSMSEIKIPSFVASIENSAFCKCSSLTKIKIPNSVHFIGDYAFSECKSLRRISIPSSVQSIGNYAFNECTSLIKISLPSSITVINNFLFNGCISLKQISIPSTLISIGESAFCMCKSLTQISIPSSVTSIGKAAFKDCKKLKKINLSTFLASIESSVFYGCSSLAISSIPFSVKTIGDHAFYGCSSLTFFIVSISVESIGQYAFSECGSLKKLEIHSRLEKIDDHVFSGCKSLVFISIPISLVSIGNFAFYGCSNLANILFSSVKTIGQNAFCGCSSLKKISLPSSVTSIGENAFSECSLLEEITLPFQLDFIGKGAFSKCESLDESVTHSTLSIVDGNMTLTCRSFMQLDIDYDCTNKIYSDKSSSSSLSALLTVLKLFTLIKVSIMFNLTSFKQVLNFVLDLKKNQIPQIRIVVIFAGMRKIEDYFDVNEDINEIQIQSPANTIGKNAFRDFRQLYKVSILSDLKVIGDSAFNGCNKLSQIEIPSSVETIGESAFKNCFCLTHIEIPSSVTLIGWGVFIECSSLNKIMIPKSIRAIPEYAFYKCSSLAQVSIPLSVTSIGSFAFLGCTSLLQILIPASVSTIGYSAFEKSTVLKRRAKASPRRRKIIKPLENTDK